MIKNRFEENCKTLTEAIDQAVKNRNKNTQRVRKCGKPLTLCDYCVRDGVARRVLFETKDLPHTVVFNKDHDVSQVRPFHPPPIGKKGLIDINGA